MTCAFRANSLLIAAQNAQVVELVDTHDSGSCAARRGGSSPPLSTILRQDYRCIASFEYRARKMFSGTRTKCRAFSHELVNDGAT